MSNTMRPVPATAVTAGPAAPAALTALTALTAPTAPTARCPGGSAPSAEFGVRAQDVRTGGGATEVTEEIRWLRDHC